MKKFYLLFLAFTLAIVLAACDGDNGSDSGDEGADNTENSEETESSDPGGEAEDGESASIETGEEVFQNNCASCHGQDLSGAAGPNLTEVGSNYSQDEIADIVENGTDGGMPAFPDLGDDDLDELAKWLSEHK
ncbi:cytochrome c-551 [Oceanobacillus oncorhynchi subsp. incaldanensis]|uniref:Cytochrome c-551 n=2 Tax=Oceanobacillus TaxID=182709 RepID=A0A0A1MDX8_9BACI|nr:cytochrome c [Oceanobacillus oncorhynchi]MDM8101918.1 cytochrome c [Oceanobacillus oncorhynchi]UUI42057.1 cytochrome c [Oceanobacillus oncorhynchi]GIO17376.1 cytochrome c-551 [Oceanobacillus oncorhynchi subsp. incaldanensis]CEI83580.1 Cytochrome c-551 precursor [Oceanobacillus oncorhynchi]